MPPLSQRFGEFRPVSWPIVSEGWYLFPSVFVVREHQLLSFCRGLQRYFFTSAGDRLAPCESTSKRVSESSSESSAILGRTVDSILCLTTERLSLTRPWRRSLPITMLTERSPLPSPLLPSYFPLPLEPGLLIWRLDLREVALENIIHRAFTCTARLGSVPACLITATCEVHA